jgi:hypothetical protein
VCRIGAGGSLHERRRAATSTTATCSARCQSFTTVLHTPAAGLCTRTLLHCRQQPACGAVGDKLLADAQLEDIAIKVPDDISLYNLRDAAPGIYMPRSDALEELIRYGREHMDEVLGDVSGS